MPASIELSPSHILGHPTPGEIDAVLACANKRHDLLTACVLAVLATGSSATDSVEALTQRFPTFSLELTRHPKGVGVKLHNAPDSAFVDGCLIKGIEELSFAVIRDIADPVLHGQEIVFRILRRAGALDMAPDAAPLVVCWGGHAINNSEYDYTKEVGYCLGLRNFNICTGCGSGAMKGPMKGAAIAHAKQRKHHRRYLGLTEPSIIAAEAPNPIVNRLVVLPDIEKRLEAFVRLGHGFIVFPGGVGTAEEILYLASIIMDETNACVPFPVVFTGPESARSYFENISNFLEDTFGDAIKGRYQVIINDPESAAAHIATGIKAGQEARMAYPVFNWGTRVNRLLTEPFVPTHELVEKLDLSRQQPPSQLAANLRRAFSAIVSGNIRPEGQQAVIENGPFIIHGDPTIMQHLDSLLQIFVRDGRMHLGDRHYDPCYRVE